VKVHILFHSIFKIDDIDSMMILDNKKKTINKYTDLRYFIKFLSLFLWTLL